MARFRVLLRAHEGKLSVSLSFSLKLKLDDFVCQKRNHFVAPHKRRAQDMFIFPARAAVRLHAAVCVCEKLLRLPTFLHFAD